MTSLLGFLRQLLGSDGRSSATRTRRHEHTASANSSQAPTRAAQTRAKTTHVSLGARKLSANPQPGDVTMVSAGASADDRDADAYLARIQKKINRLAEEFALGTVNREQFQQLFEHYQSERTAIQNWMAADIANGDWKDLSNEGRSIVIRSQNTAKVLGYAIYANESGMPLTTIGNFDIDPDLAVPMLSSYRSATKEIFGGEMRSTEIEGGKWLCFVPGESTTMLALFTREPAKRQLAIMEDLHRLFEKANRRHLAANHINPDSLAFPHTSYLGRLQ